MSKQITKINYNEMTVEDGGILYDMEDLMRLNRIYERLCTAEYLFEIQSADKPITMEQAYEMADFIREKVDDICTCESEMITLWYTEAYAEVQKGNKNMTKKLTRNDFYDDVTVYEDEITFREIIDELYESDYTDTEIKIILNELINDLISTYIVNER